MYAIRLAFSGDSSVGGEEHYLHAAETSSAPGCEERKPVEFDEFNTTN